MDATGTDISDIKISVDDVLSGKIFTKEQLMSNIVELSNDISILCNERERYKTFIKDCSVSHIESRYKYRAQLLIKELQ